MTEYNRGYAEGQRNTARNMAKAALKVEKQLRLKIEKLEATIEYLRTCVSCSNYDCQKKRCILQNGTCKNLNKWRMPE